MLLYTLWNSFTCEPPPPKKKKQSEFSFFRSNVMKHTCHIYIYEEVLLRVKEQRNILHEISKRKANWIGRSLRRNCLLQQFIEGKINGGIEVTGRRGRRRKLLDSPKETRGYFHLKEEALDRTMWRARFGRGLGPVVRHTTKWTNEYMYIYEWGVI